MASKELPVDDVYVRKGDQLLPYSGPAKVLKKGPKFFRLDIWGKVTAVSVDRLKPQTGAAAPTPVAPSCRSHLPASSKIGIKEKRRPLLIIKKLSCKWNNGIRKVKISEA